MGHLGIDMLLRPTIAALQHDLGRHQPDFFVLVVEAFGGALQRLGAVLARGHLEVPDHHGARLLPGWSTSPPLRRAQRIAGLALWKSAHARFSVVSSVIFHTCIQGEWRERAIAAV